MSGQIGVDKQVKSGLFGFPKKIAAAGASRFQKKSHEVSSL